MPTKCDTGSIRMSLSVDHNSETRDLFQRKLARMLFHAEKWQGNNQPFYCLILIKSSQTFEMWVKVTQQPTKKPLDHDGCQLTPKGKYIHKTEETRKKRIQSGRKQINHNEFEMESQGDKKAKKLNPNEYGSMCLCID